MYLALDVEISVALDVSWTYFTIYAKIFRFLMLVFSKKNKKVQDCGVKVIIFLQLHFVVI